MAQIGTTRCEAEFEPLVLPDRPVEPVGQLDPLPATARGAEPAPVPVPVAVRAPA
jgi:hypothetical protein